MRARTYALSVEAANAGKMNQVRDLLPVWRSAMVTVQRIQVSKMRSGRRIGWLTSADLQFGSPLSQRQLRSVTNQVNDGLKSWAALAKSDMRKLIAAEELSGEVLQEVHLLNNLLRWWYADSSLELAGEEYAISRQAQEVSQRLIQVVLQSRPFPNFSRVNVMVMDSTVCTPGAAKTSLQHSRWFRVSTLTKGKPVQIPAYESEYYRSRAGKEAGVTQVSVHPDTGEVGFSRVKFSEPAEQRNEGRAVALDWGLTCLFTTDAGDRLGQQSYLRLTTLDAQITELQKSLQRNGIKPNSSKRYRRLNQRLRASVKNEVNRVINQLIEDDVSELVLESLDFRGGSMSGRLNRLLTRAGRGAVRQKLSSVQEDAGVRVTLENPAYTSQQCSGCGYTSRRNRPSQATFRCLFCGKTSHADVNAARVLRQRRSLPSSNGLKYVTTRGVLDIIDENFQSRWGLNFADVVQRQERGCSTATSAHTAELT